MNNDDDRKSPPPLAPHSTPPRRLDDEYVRRKLDLISRAQSKQAQIEAERTGASKNTSRLIAIFGTLITAAAIGGFGWVWSTSSETSRQSSAIERISERQAEHDPNPPGHEEMITATRTNERRIDGVDAATKQINARLDRIEREGATRHSEVLEELRRLRNTRRRTW